MFYYTWSDEFTTRLTRSRLGRQNYGGGVTFCKLEDDVIRTFNTIIVTLNIPYTSIV